VTTWAVTGGSGFVGRHLLRRLLAEGHAVSSLDLAPFDLPGAHAIAGDVRDPEAARRLCRGADVVVHAAAALPSSGSRRELRSVNVDGTRTILSAARSAGVRRVVVVSSGVVYGLQPPPVREDAVPAPIEPYGRTKLAAEALARAEGAVILRPTAVVGPERLGLYAILFRWIDEGRRVYVLGSGRTRYQLLAVDDLVEAVVRAAHRGCPGETYNLGATQVRTIREELEELIRRAGSASTVAPLPARPARLVLAGLAAARLSPLSPWHYRSAGCDVVLDVSKARRELGWEPRRSNAEALVATYDWYAAHSGEAGRGRTHRTAWTERALALARRLS
jgi:nucleoside-diphosphate-sugar epimerase